MALFRSGQYLCTAPLTAKSTVSDFLSNSFKGINRQRHYFVRGSTFICHGAVPGTSKNFNLPLDYYGNIVYNLICNLIDFVKRNTPYSE